ncbi:c-type cytochrome [Bryobacter aggregatus]|uniref:c-type cytochrome n=1 Tax=Bryobacter aggregatus TaxID=360054 RepID=UPI0012BAE423|nr:c-type cytochrome [Bryobacter aggregatus]
MIRPLPLIPLLLLSLSGCKQAPVLEPVPEWAYPTNPAPAPGPKPPVPQGPFQIKSSQLSFTRAQLSNLFAAPDWSPEGHPTMPSVVSHGREPEVRACAYCHLPTGSGRPENSRLAGLPIPYFVDQMKAFRDGSRTPFLVDRAPTINMTKTAKAMTDAEIETAARYFASLKPLSFVRVVETTMVPKSRIAGWLFHFQPEKGEEALGQRILEGPEDFEQFELRDPETRYIAYAPVGSLALGKRLAETWGNNKELECSSCHGPGYRGKEAVPGIAGRSPSAIVRQLYDMKAGVRRGGKTSEMEKVVKEMTNSDMVALAAYIGSLRP